MLCTMIPLLKVLLKRSIKVVLNSRWSLKRGTWTHEQRPYQMHFIVVFVEWWSLLRGIFDLVKWERFLLVVFVQRSVIAEGCVCRFHCMIIVIYLNGELFCEHGLKIGHPKTGLPYRIPSCKCPQLYFSLPTEFHITCPLLSWASRQGATNNLSHVLNMCVSYSRSHADGILNSTQTINQPIAQFKVK